MSSSCSQSFPTKEYSSSKRRSPSGRSLSCSVMSSLCLEGVMNFGSETVAFWYGYSKTIPK
jgi:hypothetical protein